MEKFITVTYENKLYKMPLTPELNTALSFSLGDYYTFNEKGYLIRKTNDIKQTIEINKIIQKVFLDVLSKYDLDAETKKFLTSLKVGTLDENFITAHAYLSSVDNLVLVYNEVYKKQTKIETKENLSEKKTKPIDSPSKIMATPAIPLNTDLSKEILANEKLASKNIELAYKVLLRAAKNPKFKNFLTEEKIKNAINKIIVCKDKESFKNKYIELSKPESKEELAEINKRAFGVAAFNNPVDGKTYINSDCPIEVIIHELVHNLSLNNEIPGLKQIGTELIPDDIDKRLKISTNSIESLKIDYSDALNEAITNYITQQLLPELKVVDAYSYGATFIDSYIKASKGEELDIEQEIFKAYFNANKNSLAKVINNLNTIESDYFFKMLDSMYVSQSLHIGTMPLKYSKTLQTKEQIEAVLNKLRKRIEIKLQESGKLEEFHKFREEYALKESEMIKQIQSSKKQEGISLPELENNGSSRRS